ncbi:SET domain-containing protein [Nanoarchaeota archaeon]
MILKHTEVRHSEIHGTGVFARNDIFKGERVIEYVGEKISKEESDKRYNEWLNNKSKDDGTVYIFTLDDNYDIDGNVDYNTARFINHSCSPNCETDNTDGHIYILAKRDIKKGEEITYNYGYNLEDYEDHPCRCGSPDCVGYIVDEDDWPELKEILKKKESHPT